MWRPSITKCELSIAALLGLAVTSFAGCSSSKENADSPEELAKDAEDDIKEERFTLATEKLREIKNKFPYSPQAHDATLRLGDVYFLQESYGESAAQYEAFKDLYPKSKKSGYAQYQIALSYFNDTPSKVARDQTPGFRAEIEFKNYLKYFADGEYAQEATKKLAETRTRLAEKEIYIARFYKKRSQKEAAKGRYEKIIHEYSDTPVYSKAVDELKEVTSE